MKPASWVIPIILFHVIVLSALLYADVEKKKVPRCPEIPDEIMGQDRKELIQFRNECLGQSGALLAHANQHRDMCTAISSAAAQQQCISEKEILRREADEYEQTVRRLRDRIELVTYRSRPRQYTNAGVGLVGGTSWIYGYNVPPGPEGERLRLKVNEMLRKQRQLAGVSEEEFINTKEYDFIIGVASSHDWHDLFTRVIHDQWPNDRFSANHQELYASLKGRQFDRLDCHSNGAMVCLAAIELGDVKTRHVRLLGPQITPDALMKWQKLLEQGKIASIELHINKGDPIPGISYLHGGLVETGLLLLGDDIQKAINIRAPGIYVEMHACSQHQPYIDIENCHSMKLYQLNVHEE